MQPARVKKMARNHPFAQETSAILRAKITARRASENRGCGITNSPSPAPDMAPGIPKRETPSRNLAAQRSNPRAQISNIAPRNVNDGARKPDIGAGRFNIGQRKPDLARGKGNTEMISIFRSLFSAPASVSPRLRERNNPNPKTRSREGLTRRHKGTERNRISREHSSGTISTPTAPPRRPENPFRQ